MPTPADLQRDLTRLTGLAAEDLAQIWRQVATAAEAREALNDLLPALIRQYGEAAALLGAEWYDDLREQHLIDAPAFAAQPVALADQGVGALIGWAAEGSASLDSMRSLVAGGTSRRVTDWARETVIGSALTDPRAEGWMRVGRPGACGFCRMIVGRGAVYTESSVRFASHDSCHCGAAPKWAGVADVFDVEEYRRSARRAAMDDTTREADDARARDWIKSHL